MSVATKNYAYVFGTKKTDKQIPTLTKERRDTILLAAKKYPVKK